MGEAAEATVQVEGDTPGDKAQEQQDPFAFNVGGEKEEEETPPAKEPEAPAPAEDKTPDIAKQFEELKSQNVELQKALNRKFYNLRQERKQKEKEGGNADKPQFTDAQLLKILEEHRDDPAVTLQVIKHMTEQTASKTKKEAVEDTVIKQRQEVTQNWLHQNAPEIFDESSEVRATHERMLSELRLEDHPLGDFLAAAAAKMTVIPEMLKQAEEAGRKKALAEAAEASRTKAVKGGGPAGGGKPPLKGNAGDAQFKADGKNIGLTGSALDLYVQMRKQAKNQRQVMEA